MRMKLPTQAHFYRSPKMPQTFRNGSQGVDIGNVIGQSGGVRDCGFVVKFATGPSRTGRGGDESYSVEALVDPLRVNDVAHLMGCSKNHRCQTQGSLSNGRCIVGLDAQ